MRGDIKYVFDVVRYGTNAYFWQTAGRGILRRCQLQLIPGLVHCVRLNAGNLGFVDRELILNKYI